MCDTIGLLIVEEKCVHKFAELTIPVTGSCAPSAEQSAESGGASARHPRGGPCSGGGSLHCLGRQGEGASLCCLFMRPPQRLGIGRQEDVPAPAPRALTTDAVAPRPSAPTAPPPLYGGRVAGLGPAPIRGPGTPPETSCPAAPLTTGFLRQLFYGEETVFASRPRISLVLVWGKEGKLEAAGCSMWKGHDSAMTLSRTLESSCTESVPFSVTQRRS